MNGLIVMEMFLGLLLLLLLISGLLWVARRQQRRWIQASVGAFAILSCVALAVHLRENPPIAWLLLFAAIYYAAEMSLDWAGTQIWALLKTKRRKMPNRRSDTDRG